VSLVADAAPVIDPNTQALTRGTPFLSGGVVHIPWAIVTLTADQQNDVSDKAALLVKAQAAYTALKAHTATANQMQDIIAVLLRYVARQEGQTLT
jgi:hypothetical protein